MTSTKELPEVVHVFGDYRLLELKVASRYVDRYFVERKDGFDVLGVERWRLVSSWTEQQIMGSGPGEGSLDGDENLAAQLAREVCILLREKPRG